MIDFNYRLAVVLVNSVFLHKVMASLMDMDTKAMIMHPVVGDGLQRLVYSTAKGFGFNTEHLNKIEQIISAEVTQLLNTHGNPREAVQHLMVLDDEYSEGEFQQWYKRVAARVAKEVL